jgi:hypothetical protein
MRGRARAHGTPVIENEFRDAFAPSAGILESRIRAL